MKVALISLHLVLIAGFSFSIYRIWYPLTYVQPDKNVFATIKFPELPNYQPVPIANDRSMFDVIPPVPVVSEKTVVEGKSSTEHTKKTFMVKGIFISGTSRFALIEPDSANGDVSELMKVSEGTLLEDFTVSAIGPRVVSLKNSGSGESIRLKTFSRIESTADPVMNNKPDVFLNPAHQSKNKQP